MHDFVLEGTERSSSLYISLNVLVNVSQKEMKEMK